jgi:hypothetical protein
MSSPALIRDALLSVFSTSVRKPVLDKKPHFVPLNLASLEVTLGKVIAMNQEDVAEDEQDSFASRIISLTELRTRIITYVKTKHQFSVVLNNGITKVYSGGTLIENARFEETVTDYTPAVMYRNSISDENLVGVLYSSYNATGSGLFSTFLNKELSGFLKSTIYEGTKYKKGFDIGHILNVNDPTVANTPLYLKTQKLLEALNSVSDVKIDFEGIPSTYRKTNYPGIAGIKTAVESLLTNFASHSTYGPKIDITIGKDFSGLLMKVNANIVVIQDRFENQAIYANLVEKPFSDKIMSLLKSVNFSRSFNEEIEYRLTSAFKTGIVDTKGSTAKVSLASINPIKTNSNAGITTSNTTSVMVEVPTMPSAPAVSLASLQQLLNDNLQNIVSANMGDGTSRNILNYKTGRFAASVKVERLSQSRAGMITAYYSYMKSPYQTFEPGFAQGYPQTRDPKLLIARSIRELAATKVGNRMRAVSI